MIKINNVIAVVNHKGGVGKTETVYNLAHAMARRGGVDTTVIDLDPQANLTVRMLGSEPERHTSGSMMLQYSDWQDAARLTNTAASAGTAPITILPANENLEYEMLMMANKKPNHDLLAKAIADIPGNIIIDCPPALGVLAANAIAAADGVIIPTTTDPRSVDGAGKTIALVNELQNAGITRARVLGIIAFAVNLYTNKGKAGMRHIYGLDANTLGCINHRVGDDAGMYTDAYYEAIERELYTAGQIL